MFEDQMQPQRLMAPYCSASAVDGCSMLCNNTIEITRMLRLEVACCGCSVKMFVAFDLIVGSFSAAELNWRGFSSHSVH